VYHSRPNGSASGNQIDAAMIFARADFVNVLCGQPVGCIGLGLPNSVFSSENFRGADYETMPANFRACRLP